MRLHSLIHAGVVAVGPDATLADVAALMRREDIGSLTVNDDAGNLVGIITERDLVRCVAEAADPTVVRVARFMTGDPVVACPMGLRHLPVVADGRVLGMVSIRDLLEASALPAT